MHYHPTVKSLRTHPLPTWYEDAKLGMMICWGLYSVPGWAPLTGELAQIAASEGFEAFFARNPYAEWYWNSMRIEGSPTWHYHRQNYGPAFDYDDFAGEFNAGVEKWDPDEWGRLFKRAHVRYTVLVTKHADGFLLWPSKRTSPYKRSYHTRRDVVGDLAAAMRRHGIRPGAYYSGGMDWSFKPYIIRALRDVYQSIVQTPEYIEYVDYHWRELIDRHGTPILWNDIGYPVEAPALELFAYFYNAYPEGVINDRFGQATEPQQDEEGVIRNPDGQHYDFKTPEYSSYGTIQPFKWETTRGIGYSYGFNRAETAETFLSAAAAVRLLVDIVSKNGNLILNVGPMPDGTIPELQRRCLEGLGAWLDVNGEAVFGTRPWRTAEGDAGGKPVRFTARPGTLYATVFDPPAPGNVLLSGLLGAPNMEVRMLGQDSSLVWRQADNGVFVFLPSELPATEAYSLRLSPQPDLLKG
jgi:alpha-L-fucosidase